MRAKIRDTELFFDIDGSALVPDGGGLQERPTAFLNPRRPWRRSHQHTHPMAWKSGASARIAPPAYIAS